MKDIASIPRYLRTGLKRRGHDDTPRYQRLRQRHHIRVAFCYSNKAMQTRMD